MNKDIAIKTFILVLHLSGKLEKAKCSAVGNQLNKLWCIYSTDTHPAITHCVTEGLAITHESIQGEKVEKADHTTVCIP